MKHTKGKFADGTKGWKAVKYIEKVGFATHEIHYSDDGECVAEVVHGEANAKLIAASPVMYNYIKTKADEGCKDAKQVLATLQ